MNVIVNLRIAGLHCWPDAPVMTARFLQDPHRHEFHICCKKAVSHGDREIEVIEFKNSILAFLKDEYPEHCDTGAIDFDELSCEQIAVILLKRFDLSYCSVLEDGENGAEVSA